MFSSTSFAGWTKVTETVNGTTYYVDFERIRKHDGYVYYWDLTDNLKPNKNGYWSVKTYIQGDCKLFRIKNLSYSAHKEPMGGGTGGTGNFPEKDWKYFSPNSSGKYILKTVCAYVKNR